MSDQEKPSTGWGNPRPFDSKSKFHYFTEDKRSLCGKWARLLGQPEVEEGMDDHGDNCAVCKKKIAAYRRAKEQEAKANV